MLEIKGLKKQKRIFFVSKRVRGTQEDKVKTSAFTFENKILSGAI